MCCGICAFKHVVQWWEDPWHTKLRSVTHAIECPWPCSKMNRSQHNFSSSPQSHFWQHVDSSPWAVPTSPPSYPRWYYQLEINKTTEVFVFWKDRQRLWWVRARPFNFLVLSLVSLPPTVIESPQPSLNQTLNSLYNSHRTNRHANLYALSSGILTSKQSNLDF